MTLIAAALYSIIGISAGLIGGLLGIGGGLIVVPALLLVFQWQDFPSAMHMAVGTSLAAMIFTSAASAWAHLKQKGIAWELFLAFAPGIITGAMVGCMLADRAPGQELKWVFEILLCCIGVYLLLFSKREESKLISITPKPFIVNFLGVMIGMFSSLLGIGGGVMTVPLLTILQAPLKNAISTSAVTGFLVAVTGSSFFIMLGLKQEHSDGSIGYLYLPAFLIISLFSSLTAPYGAKLAYVLPTATLTRIFGLFLIGLSVVMICC